MSLQKVQLGLTERKIISGVLGRQEEVNVPVARTMREISKQFEVRKTEKLIGRVVEEAIEAKVRIPDWSDLDDLATYLEEVNKELETPIELKEHEKQLAGTIERTIDEHYVQWLKKALETAEWNIAKIPTQNGRHESITIALSLGQAIAIAQTADALDAAQDFIKADKVRAERHP